MQNILPLKQYAYLLRLDKPIGILLLLWPTWWALWLASAGHPDRTIFVIFTLGVFLMRSAGCILNDIADRNVDGKVARTQYRPLATKAVSLLEAFVMAGLLLGAALFLVSFCNVLTIKLAFIGAMLAASYPLLKRVTHLPQLGLGIAFSWGIPMAFAAQNNAVSFSAWVLFFTSILWPVIYDTMYAMVDRADDVKIGVKSTAILFAKKDKWIVGILQCVFLVMLLSVGVIFDLSLPYFLSLIAVVALFAYQQWLIKEREPNACFKAFLNNNWVGAVIFLGIFVSYAL